MLQKQSGTQNVGFFINMNALKDEMHVTISQPCVWSLGV